MLAATDQTLDAVLKPHPTLSVAILTLNEERRIAQCIASASWAHQVVLADSGSVDQTVAIAQAQGAEVFVYPDWKGFAEQRNRLIAHCTGDYIFFLDADEVLTPQLSAELQHWVASGERAVGAVAWLQVAYGRHLTGMTDRGRVRRLFERRNLLGFEGVVHETSILRDPGVGEKELNHRLPHYSRETIHDSLRKLTQYAMLGAAKRQGKTHGGVLRGLASGAAAFFRIYLFRKAWTGGGPGFLFAFFVALECFFRYAALKYDRSYLREDIQR
jgi:glycosyltransferase involved in cell wall biosynthesis